MFDQTISRERPIKKTNKKPLNHTEVTGYSICAVSLVLGFACAFNWPAFLTKAIFGLFGLYTFAILLLTFVIGISIKFSRKYRINKRYVIFSSIMLFSLLCATHIIFTRDIINMNFTDYISHGFSGSFTPGGLIFAIPSYVIWIVMGGLAGSLITLGIVFIIACTFFSMQVATKHGENKVIQKHTTSFEYNEPTKSFTAKSEELSIAVDRKYQELLQQKSRTKIDKQKSKLGLTAPPVAPNTKAIYDTAVPMNKLSPQPFITDEINQWSTDAATKFTNALQQPMYSAPQPQPIMPQPIMPQPTFQQPPWQPPVQPPQFTGQPQWTPPTPSPVFSDPCENVTPIQTFNYDEEVTPNDVIPTTRARNTHKPITPAQTSFDAAIPVTKKPFKPRRYVKPTIDLIRSESTDLTEFHLEAMNKQAMLDNKLKEFGINAKVTSFTVAPAITRFEIQLGQGTRANQVYALDPDFQYVLGTTDIRMENVTGKNAIGIEVPNKSVGCVSVKDIIASKEFQNHKSPLAVALGKDLNDELVIGDIGSMPHLLIAGSTGSGKSVCINTVLTSLLYRAHPDDVKLLLVDMKLVELNMYNEIPHMLVPRSIGDVLQAINALKWMQTEMQRRYKILEANRFNHISQYHALQGYQSGELERMPYIIMVIDEAADLIHNGKKDVEDAIKRLSALARACGIHIILATQRPSVDVITAVIKTNFPVRIGFKVNSRGDSTTIINETGCEKLVGRGDMLFSKEGKINRVQGAFIEIEETRRVMNFIRENNACEFDTELEDLILNGPPPENAANGFGDGPAAARNQDPMFVPILRWLVRDDNLNKTASIAGIQRMFSLGFSRAGRIVDQMAQSGYVSQGNGAKVRDVLISRTEVENIYGAE